MDEFACGKVDVQNVHVLWRHKLKDWSPLTKQLSSELPVGATNSSQWPAVSEATEWRVCLSCRGVDNANANTVALQPDCNTLDNVCAALQPLKHSGILGQWVLQVMFTSASSCILLVFIVSLHVSAYMAIFKCVGYFICICLKDSASLQAPWHRQKLAQQSTSFWRVYYNTWRWPCEAEICRRIINNKKWMLRWWKK
jgi:hypothetical protein